jgi:hypothetical protein
MPPPEWAADTPYLRGGAGRSDPAEPLRHVVWATPFHDAHTAILMREHGIRRIVTRDTDYHRFGFLEPIDPMA